MKTGKIRCHPVTFGYVDEKYLSLKKEIINNLKKEEHFDDEISLNILMYLLRDRAERSDLDNYLKAIIDAIDESDIINKENQIASIYIERIKVDSSEEEGLEIEINSVKKIN